MPFLRQGTGIAAGSVDGNGVTTGTYNTTLSTLLVAAISDIVSGVSTLTDLRANNWSFLGSRSNSTETISFYCCVNPIVDAAHTFSATTVSGFPAIAVNGFSGIGRYLPIGPFSSTNNTAASTLTLTPGVPVDAANFLVIGAATGTQTVTAISAPHTLLNTVARSVGFTTGIAMFGGIQTTPIGGPITVTYAGSAQMAMIAGLFRPTEYEIQAEAPNCPIPMLDGPGGFLIDTNTDESYVRQLITSHHKHGGGFMKRRRRIWFV